MEIENKLRARVRWQDNSRDTSWELSPAGRESLANRVPPEDPDTANYRAERYKEIVSKSYTQWAAGNTPNGFDEDGSPVDVFDPNAASEENYESPFGPADGEAHPSGERILMEQALALLTEKQRYIWDLVMVKALPQDQVADFMNVSQQMISKQVAYSKKKVMSFLEENKSRVKADDDE